MATTPVLGLNLPTVGADRDTWGTLCNDNFSTLDTFVSMAMPIGAIIDFAGITPPSGWLLCDGRLISRLTYSALFAVISTYFGSGDGSSTFALPPTPGRQLLCAGTVIDENGTTLAYSFAQKAGAVSRAIGQANLPALALTSDSQGSHNHTGQTGGMYHTHTLDTQGAHAHGGSTNYDPDHTHSAWDNGHQHTYQHAAGGGVGGGASGTPLANYGDYTGVGYASITVGAAGGHAHGITTDTQGAHSHNVSQSATWGSISTDGAHVHNFNLGGGGTLLNISNPLLVCYKIIYAGQQAAAAMMAALSAPPARRLLSSPLRAGM